MPLQLREDAFVPPLTFQRAPLNPHLNQNHEASLAWIQKYSHDSVKISWGLKSKYFQQQLNREERQDVDVRMQSPNLLPILERVFQNSFHLQRWCLSLGMLYLRQYTSRWICRHHFRLGAHGLHRKRLQMRHREGQRRQNSSSKYWQELAVNFPR